MQLSGKRVTSRKVWDSLSENDTTFPSDSFHLQCDADDSRDIRACVYSSCSLQRSSSACLTLLSNERSIAYQATAKPADGRLKVLYPSVSKAQQSSQQDTYTRSRFLDQIQDVGTHHLQNTCDRLLFPVQIPKGCLCTSLVAQIAAEVIGCAQREAPEEPHLEGSDRLDLTYLFAS